jgi:hypothetical protein
MKLQDASRKEIRRVAVGSVVGLGLMIAAFFVLSLLGVGKMDYRIFLSGILGTVIAVLNFTVLCLTIQKAAQTEDQKQMKARFQLSYNVRLIIQCGWVVAAFLLPCFHVIAAAVPLLFPTLTIYYLQFRGILVTPSLRKNPPAEDLPEEDRQDTFEA